MLNQTPNSYQRHVFIIPRLNPTPRPLSPLSLEPIPPAVTQLNRAEPFPIVALLFSVDARTTFRASNATTELLCAREEKKVTQTGMVNSKLLPAATDWSCLMVAVGENVCVEN